METPRPPKNPTVVDLHADDEYQRKIEEARAKRVPVGHVPMPKIRPFDEYKEEQPGVQGAQKVDPMKLLTPEQVEQLKKMGEFIPGAGSQYIINQPSAYKVLDMPPAQPQTPEPIVRSAEGGSEYANPPRPPGSGLRPQTKEDLERLAKHNQEESEKEKKKDLSEEEFTREADKLVEDVDLDGFNRNRSLLQKPERRKKIEARCSPMSLRELLEHFEVRQRVPIVPGQYEVVFRSVSGDEGLFVKRLVGEELTGSDQYFSDRYTLLSLSCGIYQINDRILPTHLDSKREINKDLFLKKSEIVLKYPEVLLADLSVNFLWFTSRIERLMVEDDFKGF